MFNMIKSKIEEENRGKIISFEHFENNIPFDIGNFFRSFIKNPNKKMQIFDLYNDENAYRMKIFSSEYEYNIRIRVPFHEEDRGYIGCFFTCRKFYTGDIDKTGCDLPDGKFEKETLDNIMYAIVENEIEPLEVDYEI